MEKETIEEQVSKGNIEKLVIIANGEAGKDFDKLKVTTMVKLYGENFVYQADYRVSREFLNPEKDVLENFLAEIGKQFRKILEGKVELNAII